MFLLRNKISQLIESWYINPGPHQPTSDLIAVDREFFNFAWELTHTEVHHWRQHGKFGADLDKVGRQMLIYPFKEAQRRKWPCTLYVHSLGSDPERLAGRNYDRALVICKAAPSQETMNFLLAHCRSIEIIDSSRAHPKIK